MKPPDTNTKTFVVSGGFLFLPISTHLEQRFGGDRINHSTTHVTMPEKSRNSGLFKALNA